MTRSINHNHKKNTRKKTKEQEEDPYLKDWDHVNHITEGNDYTRNDGWTAWVNECMGIDPISSADPVGWESVN